MQKVHEFFLQCYQKQGGAAEGGRSPSERGQWNNAVTLLLSCSSQPKPPPSPSASLAFCRDSSGKEDHSVTLIPSGRRKSSWQEIKQSFHSISPLVSEHFPFPSTERNSENDECFLRRCLGALCRFFRPHGFPIPN